MGAGEQGGWVTFTRRRGRHAPTRARWGARLANRGLPVLRRMLFTAQMSQGTKRSRTQQHDAAQAEPDLPGSLYQPRVADPPGAEVL
jgi:hypothetical protein